MREIKFRGKSKSVNEWCYGTYIFIDDNKNDPFRTRPIRETHKIVFWCSGDWNLGGWVDEEVIPETIGQYTGLKDKNEKEIYEGDIILWCNKKYLVKFRSGMFYASVEEFNEDVHGGYPLWSLVKYHDEQDCGVVVGNIYENKKETK